MDPRPIQAWLLDADTGRLGHAPFVEALAESIVAQGVPLTRASMSLRTRHPEVYVLNGRWTRGEGARELRLPHTLQVSDAYLDSPIRRIHVDRAPIRVDLRVPDVRYPICRELKEQGMTDYYIQPMLSSAGDTSSPPGRPTTPTASPPRTSRSSTPSPRPSPCVCRPTAPTWSPAICCARTWDPTRPSG